MTRAIAVASALLAALWFPWPFAALLAFGGAFVEPLLPLATGLLIDTLYYLPHSGLPSATLLGAGVTLAAFLVRSRLKTGIIV